MQPSITSACPYGAKGYMVAFGTGRLLNPEDDFLDQSVQTVYAIWDWSLEWADEGKNPKGTFLGSFGGYVDSSAVLSCYDSCGDVLGDTGTIGTCMYECQGSSECEEFCLSDNVSCMRNCGKVRGLSNLETIVGADNAQFVTLLQQTQIWAGGINYNSDGSVAEQVYGTMDFDSYDTIARVVSENSLSWYLPNEHDIYASSSAKTPKHVGWFFDLPANGERIARDMTIVDGKLIFTSTIPSDSPCQSGGSTFNWAVDACSGSRLSSAFFDANKDESIDSNDYVNVGTNENSIWVSISGTGEEGINPAASIVKVEKGGGRILHPGENDEIVSGMIDVNSGIIYWRPLDWQ
jgi:type IV pilus assembly protein PilY1